MFQLLRMHFVAFTQREKLLWSIKCKHFSNWEFWGFGGKEEAISFIFFFFFFSSENEVKIKTKIIIIMWKAHEHWIRNSFHLTYLIVRAKSSKTNFTDNFKMRWDAPGEYWQFDGFGAIQLTQFLFYLTYLVSHWIFKLIAFALYSFTNIRRRTTYETHKTVTNLHF